MPDDLVKRLRAAARGLRSFYKPGAVELIPEVTMDEAAARIEALTAERDKAQRDRDCFKRVTRAHWEALCAMRNSINEYIPMPNTDSGPLFSPEDGPIYADIAERVAARIEALTAERDALLARAEAAEARVKELERVNAALRAANDMLLRAITGDDNG